MSTKRKVDALLEAESNQNKRVKFNENVKKHTLDSDEEEDNEELYNVLDDNDIEGEEEGAARQDGETRMTAFNMQEEMEMGHFDKDGHFIWKNEKEVRDNWLDNIDWHRVKDKDKDKDKGEQCPLGEQGLGAESDEEMETSNFNEIDTYRKIVAYLKPKESINKALRRLGGDTVKLSSVERLKRKKEGTLNSGKEVTELTELANEILTQLGNMDVYQETYEHITQKLENHDKKNKSKAKIVEAELDMYADDFGSKEQQKLVEEVPEETPKVLMWEFKWEQDKDKVEGPFDTPQMSRWSTEGHFKTGVWVRKCDSDDANFYSSNRIDFDLYL